MLPNPAISLPETLTPEPPKRVWQTARTWPIRVLVPLLLLALWEIAVRFGWLDALFFPPPTKLFDTAVLLTRNGDLGPRIATTLARAGSGFAIGALAGVLCGVAMGAVRLVRLAFSPLVSALYSVPKITLLPMLLLLAGVGEAPRQILIAATSFLVVVMHTQDGVQRVSRHFVEMARQYGASTWLVFRRVYLPACLPQLFTGIRLGMGRALVITISAELLTATGGLGGMVARAWQTFAIEQLYVAVIMSALLGACIHGTLRFLEARMLPWSGSGVSDNSG